MNINVDFAEAAGGKGFPRSLGTFLLNPCFHAVALFRLSALLYRCHLEPLAKIVWCLNRMLYHVDLDYKAKLAPGFRLVHGLGVVIGAGVVSEGPLTVYQGVTIGGSHGRHREDGRGGGLLAAPIREQRYRVTNSCIFGPIYVGDGAIVKAARIVTKDVGPGDKI